ncbi:MAG: hypothetical protein ACOYLF_17355 [Blastocatellia bacterium]
MSKRSFTREVFITDLASDPGKYSAEIVIRAITDNSFVPSRCDYCGGIGEVQGVTNAPWDTVPCPECCPETDDHIPF